MVKPPPSRYNQDDGTAGSYRHQPSSSRWADSSQGEADNRGFDDNSGKRRRESDEYGSNRTKRWESHRGYQTTTDDDSHNKFAAHSWNNTRRGNNYNTQHRNQSYRQRSGEKDDYYGPPSEPQRRDRNDSSSSSWGPPPAAAGDQRSRSNSTSRYRQDTNNGDWKCLECNNWNYPDEHRCARCGIRYEDSSSSTTPLSRDDRRGSRGRRSDSFDYRGGYHHNDRSPSGDTNDDFGEKRPDKRNRKKKKQEEDINEKRKKKFLWPPIFEQDGSSYVFDARSSFFYEAKSNFFYDPKTKLYYSNDKKVYYRHCPDAAEGNVPLQDDKNKKDDDPDYSPLFQQVSVDGPSGEENPENNAILGLGAVSQQQPPTTAKIAICLKTKKLTSSSSSKKETKKDANSAAQATTFTSTSSNTPSIIADKTILKKHQADMDVWEKREKEIRGTMATRENASTTTTATTTNGLVVKTTKKGLPICVLCKRKFPSIEKLRQHEKLSTLHKTNLEKAAATKGKRKLSSTDTDTVTNQLVPGAAPPQQQEQLYRDRAQERRVMHGPESGGATSSMIVVNDAKEEEHRMTEIVRPEDNLGTSNIGNQMLQKLGWKAGNSLGSGGTNIDGNNNKEKISLQQEETSGGSTTLQKNVLKDWERIESLASQGQSSTGVSNRAGIGSK